MTANENLHNVTFDADTQELDFTCLGNETSECHIYPDDVETWGPDTPKEHFVPHERCWAFDWFDNHATEYEGEDGVQSDVNHNIIPSISRTGPITTSFEVDFVEWDWAT